MSRPFRPDPLPAPDPARLLARWAGASLALTVLLGLALRAAMRWPALLDGVPASFAHLVHAHSHVGFFGWAMLGLSAVAAGRARPTPVRARVLAVLAHVAGAGSVLALLAFAWQGYGTVSIALSALHVGCWVALVAALWPMRGAAAAERGLWRAAFALLLVAGAATVVPVLLKVRGIEDGWPREAGIRLFLSLFVQGWIALGAVAAVAPRLRADGATRGLLRAGAALVAVGAFLGTPLHVGVTPPAAWLSTVGRGGTALLGLGTLALAAAMLRAPLPMLARGAAWLAALVGVLEVLAGAGVGGALVHARPVVIAYLHLLLLGVATPLLLTALRPLAAARVAPRALAVALHGGLAAMLAALLAMGWPWLGTHAAALGLGPASLLTVAAGGGGAYTLAVLALLLLPGGATRDARAVSRHATPSNVDPRAMAGTPFAPRTPRRRSRLVHAG